MNLGRRVVGRARTLGIGSSLGHTVGHGPTLSVAAFVAAAVVCWHPATAATAPEAAVQAPPPGDVRTLTEPEAELIRKLQDVLADLGLYRGDRSGTMNAATQAALRAFQHQAGVPVDGLVTEAIVELAHRHHQARTLTQRLQTARREDAAAARRALLGAAATESLLAGRRHGRDEAPGAGTECGDPVSLPCVLGRAFASARDVSPRRLRDWALGDVAALQANAGLIDAAAVSLRQIGDPRLVLAAIGDLAAAHAAAGEAGKALALAMALPQAAHRAPALLAVARAACAGNACAGEEWHARALALLGPTVAAVADPLVRIGLHMDASVVAERSGHHGDADTHLSAAMAVARRQHEPSVRTRGLRLVASGLVDLGRGDRAAALLDDLPADGAAVALKARAMATEAAQGRSATVLAAVDQIATQPHGEYRAVALATIAEGQTEGGDADGAERTMDLALTAAEDMTPSHARSLALFKLSQTALRLGPGFTGRGRRAAAAIADPGLRAAALWTVALGERSGNGQDEKETAAAVARAEEAMAMLEASLDRVWALSEAASRLAALGRGEAAHDVVMRAMTLADAIVDPWSRTRALITVANALMALGSAGDDSAQRAVNDT